MEPVFGARASRGFSLDSFDGAGLFRTRVEWFDLALKKKLRRLALLSVVSLVFGVAGLAWWCAAEICRPSKRPIREGAARYFKEDTDTGFRVDSFSASNGMPWLVCVPVPVDSYSQRAAILREQLVEKGVTPVPSGEIVGTVLILHGRRGRKENYLPVAERLCAAGFRCVIPDLPAHGTNPEKSATYGVKEAPMVLQAYHELAAEFGFGGEPCGILGQSMGGSVAIHTAALEGSPFEALVIVSSFDRLSHVIKSQTEQMLGRLVSPIIREPADLAMGWMSEVKFSEVNPVDKAPRVTAPALVVHGDADRKVPTRNGRALFEALPDGSGKEWLIVPGANHHDVMITDFPLYAEMSIWFLRHLKQL